MFHHYQRDIICNEHNNNVIKLLTELNYCVIINNKRSSYMTLLLIVRLLLQISLH